MSTEYTERDLGVTEAALERPRLQTYLAAEGGPLALVEVESAAQADDLAVELERDLPDGTVLRVQRVSQDNSWSEALEWVESFGAETDSSPVYLIIGAASEVAEEERTKDVWRWMDSQRERWAGAAGKVVFVLTPSQVDSLARHAHSLWDWIPLKFNLLRRLVARPGDYSLLDAAHADYASGGGQTPGYAAALLPALRQQLLTARQTGLAESIVRREYALPLFHALVNAYRIGEARGLLRSDLQGVESELPSPERARWLESLGWLSLLARDLPEAERAYHKRRDLAAEQDDQRGIAAAEHGLGIVAQERRRFDDAERWYRQSLEIWPRIGAEYEQAATLHNLGAIAQERRQFDAAERWYRQSLEIKERIGDEHGQASTLHQLGRIAEERGDAAGALRFYRQAEAIFARMDDPHRLGIVRESIARVGGAGDA